MATQKHVKGFVIVGPNEGMHVRSYYTFGVKAGEAWLRFCGPTSDDKDISRKIQAWHDRGYRLREATLTIHPGDDEQ